MTGPIFHHPSPDEVTTAMLTLLACVAVRAVLVRIGIRRDVHSGLTPLVAYLASLTCTRDDLHRLDLLIFFVISVFWDRFPWDRWRRKLASKLASMTEVAKEAFQRQQSEAFS